jgi:hypothetical protein
MVRLEKATVQMRGTERDAFAMQQTVRGVFAAQPFVYPRRNLVDRRAFEQRSNRPT